MQIIKIFEDITKDDAASAGGKGASLGEMTQTKIPVPPGFVILADAFDLFLKETDLYVEIEAILSQVDTAKMHTIEHASETIQKLILEARMPQDIAGRITASFAELNAEFVAVRSSATAEDSSSAAWAGQLDSFLNTSSDTLIINVQRCWASLFTPRAIFYRFEKGLHTQEISVAVVVQKMVQSEISGIAFSVHPVTEDRNQLIIEAGYGLGEAIVSGQVTPDSYVVSKSPRQIIDSNISTQTRALYRDLHGEGNEWRDIPEPQASSQVLTEVQILELSELVIGIENHYGFPCDIEWAFEDGKFYIVQSRPITTLSQDKSPERENTEFLIKEYQKLFQWPGEFSYFLSSYFMEVYKKHRVISLHDGALWQSYMPILEKEKTLNEGLEIYVDEVKYKDLQSSIFEGYKKTVERFEDVLSLSTLTKEDVISCLQHAIQFYDAYHKTEFFYTDLAFEKQGEYPTISQNFKSFEELKIKGREYLNEMALVPDNLLQKLHSKLSTQFSISISDLTSYKISEIISLFDSKDKVSPNEIEEREIYFMVGENNSSTEIIGKKAVHEIESFLNKSSDQNILTGQIANRGLVKGKARVFRFSIGEMMNVSEQIDLMEKGEILIADTTAPEIISACKKASAIVTNQGGMMSHAAIVARELGIPCIVGIGSATEVIKDGDLVEVDADRGVVRIIEHAK